MNFRKSALLSSLAILALCFSSSAFAELCTVGRATQVLWKGDWYKATITEASPDKCKITYIGYTADDDEWVGPERLKIKILWKGDWYPGRVIKKEGANYLIGYDGYSSDDNEIVPLSRIQVR
ncbi:agenet domain-containing protein [Undibacterium sp. JH2W]|uniref:agenet domain-containing protein n=1 Tax=Undibacterium sp. JH2W TaxID=3413037 RepID=UPI003BF231D9